MTAKLIQVEDLEFKFISLTQDVFIAITDDFIISKFISRDPFKVKYGIRRNSDEFCNINVNLDISECNAKLRELQEQECKICEGKGWLSNGLQVVICSSCIKDKLKEATENEELNIGDTIHAHSKRLEKCSNCGNFLPHHCRVIDKSKEKCCPDFKSSPTLWAHSSGCYSNEDSISSKASKYMHDSIVEFTESQAKTIDSLIESNTKLKEENKSLEQRLLAVKRALD